jgi:phenylacetate-CoA ligase
LRAAGIAGYQCYATADLGLIAYETSAREGLVLDEGVIVEIVRPGTGDPVPEGEVGELVVTTLNPDYPLIRFGTGDLSAVLPGLPHGPHQHPHQGLDGPRRPDHQGARHVRAPRPGGRHRSSAFPEVQRARLVVSGEMANDQMVLQGGNHRNGRGPGPPVGRRHSRSDQAARRCGNGAARHPAQRWQGD